MHAERVLNALSIDVEDWFCVTNMESAVSFDQWDECSQRAASSTGLVLDILAGSSAKATFFVLGWIAERFPDLIREIRRRGHEVASHGYAHRPTHKMEPTEFEEDTRRGLDLHRDIGIDEVKGYRAASFSITSRTKWALPILRDAGFRYDSSVFPVSMHPDYGIPDAPFHPYEIIDGLVEVPLSVVRLLGRRIPCAGGGYFRLYPYFLTRYLIRRINREGRAAIFYLHPWELDPGQPRQKLPWLKAFRHYNSLSRTEARLRRLCEDFEFTTIREVVGL